MSMTNPVDCQYVNVPYQVSELPHRYGPRVHVLADPIALTHLARLCSPQARHPEIFRLVRVLYEQLLRAVTNTAFPRSVTRVESRMRSITERGEYHGEVIDPMTKVATVDIARGGTYPSQVLFEYLSYLLHPDAVRQDHIIMNRTTDATGTVTGAAMYGSKIGGDVEGHFVLFPDPMGATGSSMVKAISYYKEQVEGGASARYVVMNLIITPEFVRNLLAAQADVEIYTVRLDRGLSSPEVLATTPGERWDEERGLTDKQYIVPGAGGFGEVMNNAKA